MPGMRESPKKPGLKGWLLMSPAWLVCLAVAYMLSLGPWIYLGSCGAISPETDEAIIEGFYLPAIESRAYLPEEIWRIYGKYLTWWGDRAIRKSP